MADPDPPPPLLDAAAIQRAEALGLQARGIVEGYLAGEHRSPYHGFSVEFTQHREYTAGDDPRRLDWKVLGRKDRLYIKQYEQETNFVAHLVLDGSESMRYGSGAVTKFDYARTAAACLAYLILRQRDAAALAIFDTAIRRAHPRTDSLAALPRLLALLASFEPDARQTAIGPALHELAGQVRRRGIVLVLSDFFDDVDTVLGGLRRLRFGGSEVIVFHVLDPAELDFPFRGTVEFEGLEGEPRIVTRPADLRAAYRQEFGAFVARLRGGCERDGCHYVPLNTAQPWREALGGYLTARQRRRG